MNTLLVACLKSDGSRPDVGPGTRGRKPLLPQVFVNMAKVADEGAGLVSVEGGQGEMGSGRAALNTLRAYLRCHTLVGMCPHIVCAVDTSVGSEHS